MIRRAASVLSLALVVLACGPSESAAPPEAGIEPPFVLGCLSIDQGECEFVAAQVLARVPDDRGAPFGIIVHLHGCPNQVPCPKTLAVREGRITVEWADRGEPLEMSVVGPPQAPVFGAVPMAWSGLIEPSSGRVAGTGPFPFDLGHCGLSWQVDFDGSFWLPIGQVDGGASPIINNDSGQMHLLGPNIVEYRNAEGFAATLARFPGPKHLWLCR